MNMGADYPMTKQSRHPCSEELINLSTSNMLCTEASHSTEITMPTKAWDIGHLLNAYLKMPYMKVHCNITWCLFLMPVLRKMVLPDMWSMQQQI